MCPVLKTGFSVSWQGFCDQIMSSGSMDSKEEIIFLQIVCSTVCVNYKVIGWLVLYLIIIIMPAVVFISIKCLYDCVCPSCVQNKITAI